MERKIGFAIMAAAIAYAVLRFGAGTVGFKQGLDVEQLKANAHVYGLIGAAVVGGLVLALSSQSRLDHIGAKAQSKSANPTLRELAATRENRTATQPQPQRR